MDILITVLGATYSLFCISSYLVFLHCFYDTGYKWHKKKACFLFLCALIESGLVNYTLKSGSPFMLTIIWECIVYIIKCYIVFYDYTGKKLRGILRFILLSTIAEESLGVITLTSAALILPGFDFWAPELVHPISLDIFSYLLGTIFFGTVFTYLYFALYKPGIIIRCGKRELIFVIIYPLLCIVICVLITFLGKESTVTLIILACLSLLLALIFPIFLYYTRINHHYRLQTLYQENYVQAELEHFAQYKQSQEETARFRHDIRNNLLCISEMLQTGKTAEASQYLQDLLHTAETLRQKYVSGDEMLDCIIGVKSQTMAENDITFQLSGVIAGGLRWKPMDVCVVFANALDNAIEACKKLPPEGRFINMSIKSTPQYWFITLENPSANNIDTSQLFHKNGGYTSKPDHSHHGIGTYSMKHTVETYGGLLKAYCENGLFALEILIDKSNT